MRALVPITSLSLHWAIYLHKPVHIFTGQGSSSSEHGKCTFIRLIYIYIYIYAFSRRFYPKRLTLHSSDSFYIWSALAFPGNRTHDLGVANAMLYQLSYRKAVFNIWFVCLSLCAHILYLDAAKFSIKLFSFIYLTVSVVRQWNEWNSDWNATHWDYITSSLPRC